MPLRRSVAARAATLTALVLSAILLGAWGHSRPADGVATIRVVDVGAGLCCVATLPGGHYMVYDAGNFEDNGATAKDAIEEMIPEGSTIDLLVLSHTDSDHIAAVPWICKTYKVRRILRPDMDRKRDTWHEAVAAIQKESDEDDCDDVALAPGRPKAGKKYKLGDAQAVFVCGFSEPPESWEILNDSEFNNAGSIVVRLIVNGKSVLFTGDTVGRHIDGPPDQCIDAEKLMVDSVAKVPIKSEVLIAPHHGADNASSNDFISAVKPEFVIFSCGHKFHHPWKVVAQRYLDHGVHEDHMFRTDLGDDEGGKEWSMGRKNGTKDPKGDDDVEIVIDAAGHVDVHYRQPH